jgi:hypothetical protein
VSILNRFATPAGALRFFFEIPCNLYPAISSGSGRISYPSARHCWGYVVPTGPANPAKIRVQMLDTMCVESTFTIKDPAFYSDTK